MAAEPGERAARSPSGETGEVQAVERHVAGAGACGCGCIVTDAEAAAWLRPVFDELGSGLELDPVLDRVADGVRRIVAFDGFALLLADDAGAELAYRFARGVPGEVTRHARFMAGQGAPGRALADRRPVRIHDARAGRLEAGAGGGDAPVRSELAVPLVAGERVLGVLHLTSAIEGRFGDAHERWIGYLSRPLGNAIQNARLYQQARDQALSLSVLNEVSRELTAVLDRCDILERVAHAVRRLIDFQIFHVMLWNEETGLLEREKSIRFGEIVSERGGLPLGRGITGTAAAERRPVRVANVHRDPRYVDCGAGSVVRSELAVPLVREGRLVGVIDLESTRLGAFTEHHESLLTTLAASLAIALENSRLYEKMRDEERRLESELDGARAIQERLLPAAVPEAPDLDVACLYCPATALGGDFYDFLPYGPKRLAFAIGDVAGKGTPAALFASLAVGVLRGRVVSEPEAPAAMLAGLNEHVCRAAVRERFVAMLFAVWDGSARTLTLARAGFPRPWLVRDGTAAPVRVEGPALGLMRGARFEE